MAVRALHHHLETLSVSLFFCVPLLVSLLLVWMPHIVSLGDSLTQRNNCDCREFFNSRGVFEVEFVSLDAHPLEFLFLLIVSID